MKKLSKFLTKKSIIISLIFILVIVIILGVDYVFYSPSKINKYIATNIYKTPANSAFTDQNFYNCVIDGYNRDHTPDVTYTTYLSDSQLQEVLVMYCSNYSDSEELLIKNTSGIEKLTFLDTLYLSDNQLTSLDVSNNKALRYLEVMNNKITNLDVSKNTSLIRLTAYNNQLTSLNVSGATSLEELIVNNNQLTSLDVSNNVALFSLRADDNQLKTLNINGAISLEELNVNNNQLTSLNVSGATSLEELRVDDNQLTSLNVSNNKLLGDLYVNNNQLTSLDVSKNTALINLNTSKNQLTSLDVSKNISLSMLSLSNNQLTNLDVSKNTALKSLETSSNRLTGLDLRKNTLLTNLVAYGNSFEYELNPVLLGSTISLDVIQNNHLVKLPSKLSNILSAKTDVYLSSGIKVDGNVINTLKTGSQNYHIDCGLNYEQIYKFEVVDVVSDVYNVDKTADYIYVKNDDSADALENIKLVNGTAVIEDNYLVIMNGDYVIKKFNIVSLNSNFYDIDYDNKLIYIGNDTNDEFINNVTLKGNDISVVVTDNIAYIKYGKEVVESYTLVRTNIEKSYVYAKNNSDEKVLDSIEVINGIASIEDDCIVIKNGDIVVEKIDLIKFITGFYNVNYENKLIYIGNDTNDEFINNVTLKGNNVSVVVINNIAYIKYGEEVVQSYKLIRTDIESDYFYTKGMNNEEILNSVEVTNGTASIEDDYLVIRNGDIIVKRIELIEFKSGWYDIDYKNKFIYVGDDTNEEILKRVSYEGEDYLISNVDNTLTISNGDGWQEVYTLVRSNIQYDYVYLDTSVEKFLSNIHIINGTASIEGDYLVIKNGSVVVKKLDVIEFKSGYYSIDYDNKFMYVGNDTDQEIFSRVYYNGEDMIISKIDNTLTINNGGGWEETFTLIRSNINGDYVYRGGRTDEELLSTIEVINGEAVINGNSVMILHGNYLVKRVAITGLQSSVYEINYDSKFIYVGDDTNEEVINNVEYSGEDYLISNIDNTLTISDGNGWEETYTLVKMTTNFDGTSTVMHDGNIITLDKGNILDGIEVINGTKKIVDDYVVISYYKNEILRIPILTVTSDRYTITSEYVYTKFDDIDCLDNTDLKYFTKSKGLSLVLDWQNEEIAIKYKDYDEIFRLPVYYVAVSSYDVKPSTRVDDVIYMNEEKMFYEFFYDVFWTSSDNLSVHLYDDDNQLLYDGDYANLKLFGGDIVDGHLLKILYGSNVIDEYTIRHLVEYLEYLEGSEVHYTNDATIDVLKNLSIDKTFVEVRTLIDTDSEISILDNNNLELTESSKIKTGDKFQVKFADYTHQIFLSVKGDVTGTGSVGEEDVLKSYRILREEVEVEDYYRLAADVTDDGKLRINDVAKIYQYTKNKIESIGG